LLPEWAKQEAVIFACLILDTILDHGKIDVRQVFTLNHTALNAAQYTCALFIKAQGKYFTAKPWFASKRGRYY